MRFKVLFSLVLAFALSACRIEINTGSDVFGEGGSSTETHSVGIFNQVQLNGVGNAQISKGSSEYLTVTADENILPYLNFEVSNQVLVISVRNGVTLHPSTAIRYSIITRSLNNLTLSGAGNATVTGADTNNFTISIKGAGDITASGNCRFFTAMVSGTGNIDASQLKAKTAYATVKGVGNITVWATDYLNASIPGWGDIEYYGYPYLDTSITGIGSVDWLDF